MGFGNFAANMGAAYNGWRQGTLDNANDAQTADRLAQMRERQANEAAQNQANLENLQRLRTMDTSPGTAQSYAAEAPPMPPAQQPGPAAAPIKPVTAGQPNVRSGWPAYRQEQVDKAQREYDAAKADLSAWNANPDSVYADRQQRFARGFDTAIGAPVTLVQNAATAFGRGMGAVANTVAGRQVVEPSEYAGFTDTPNKNHPVQGEIKMQRLKSAEAALAAARGAQGDEIKTTSQQIINGQSNGAPVAPLSDAEKAQAKADTAAVRTKNGLPASAAAPAPGSLDLASAARYVESRGNMNAVSPKGAKSDMQVMDSTNLNPGFGVTPARDGSLEERSRVGRDYLAALQQRYGNDALALAAYNWGPGNVDAWMKSGGDISKVPAETRKYVQDVLALTKSGAQPAAAAQQAPQAGATQQAAAGPAAGSPVQNPGETYRTPGSDPYAAVRQNQMAYLTQIAQTTRGPMQTEALMKLEQLKLSDYGSQIMAMANAAGDGNANALQQLAGNYGRYTGQQVGITQGPNGQLVLHNGRQVITSGTPAMLSKYLTSNILEGLRAKDAEIANLYRTKLAEASASYQGKDGPLEQQKANSSATNEQIKGNYELAKGREKNAADAERVTRSEVTQDGIGYSIRGNGQVGVITPPTKVKDRDGNLVPVAPGLTWLGQGTPAVQQPTLPVGNNFANLTQVPGQFGGALVSGGQ